MAIEIVEITDKLEYDNIHPCDKFAHLEQTADWAGFRSEFGWETGLYKIVEFGEIIGKMVVLKKPIPLIKKKFVYIPRGPVIDWDSPQVSEILKAIRIYFEPGAGAIKINPFVEIRRWDLKKENVIDEDFKIMDKIKDSGFSHLGFTKELEGAKPRHALYLRLSGNPVNDYRALNKNARRKIKTADSRGVVVRKGTYEDIETFHKLYHTSAHRNELDVKTLEFFQEEWRHLEKTGKMKLYIAEIDPRVELQKVHKKLEAIDDIDMKNMSESRKQEYMDEAERLLAKTVELASHGFEVVTGGAALAFSYKDKLHYMHGASSNDLRSYMPNYALHWEMIKEACLEGQKIYDIGEVSGIVEKKNKYYGLYDFKRNFANEIAEYVGEFEYYYSPLAKIALNKFAPIHSKLKK